MDSFDILVMILSVALALFLLLAITLVVLLIQFVKKLKEISAKAESLVNNVESASKFFQKSAGPVAFTRVVANVVDMMKEHTKDKKKK